MLLIEKQGVSIPKLGLGTWQLRDEACASAVRYALSVGYRHIDTAQIYQNEAEVGTGIKGSGIARDHVFLTTKIWRDHMRAKDLESSLDESLRKLQTDYVDLLLIHWPVEEVPLAETMHALQEAQRKGKTRLIGVSNFTTAHLRECVEKLGVKLVTNQVEYHPYLSQQPVQDFLNKHDMFLTAYSPLGRGKIFTNETLTSIAANHGKTVGQVILRWHMQQEGVVAIPKSGTKANIENNIALFDFQLKDEEMEAISALRQKHQRLIDPDFAPAWDMAA